MTKVQKIFLVVYFNIIAILGGYITLDLIKHHSPYKEIAILLQLIICFIYVYGTAALAMNRNLLFQKED